MLGTQGISELIAQVPLGRLASVEEIARLVYWLGSKQNTYVSGQNIAIDGGFTRV
jgi:3-oxoacyl-[acyl-carrier protein] reductase